MKRTRAAAEDKTQNDSGARSQHAKNEESVSLREEIVTVRETLTILLRLPCLDFFRDAHLCETTKTSLEVDTDGGDVCDEVQFSPDSITFKDGTLETAHPIVLVHTRQYGDIEFVGSWCELHGPHVSTTPLSNRVVVQLCEKGDEQGTGDGDGGGVGGDDDGDSQSAVKIPEVPSAGVEVASLLKHPSVGVTADEARGRQKARNASWVYRRIDVPSATLVLHRVL